MEELYGNFQIINYSNWESLILNYLEIPEKQPFKIPPNPKFDLNSSDSSRVSINYNSETNDNSNPVRKEKALEINKSSETLCNKNCDNRNVITYEN